MTKLKNSNCEKPQKPKLWQSTKTQTLTKLKKSNLEKKIIIVFFYKTQKLKLLQNTKTEIVTKPKNSIYEKPKNSSCDKTKLNQIETKLKKIKLWQN